MSSCKNCRKIVRNTVLECSDCGNKFHGNCLDIPVTKQEIEAIKASKQVWRCIECTNVRRSSMNSDSTSAPSKSASTSSPTDSVLDLFKEIKADLKSTEANLGDSINKLYDRLDDISSVLEVHSKRFDECYARMDFLESENRSLKKQIALLAKHSDDLEQRSLVNSVEIHGYPLQKNEDLPSIICNIGAELGVTVKASDIESCYRFKPKSESGHSGIHVKFLRQHIKEDLLAKRRVKRDFSTRHLNLDVSPTPLYINEALCPGRRKVLHAARAAKNEKGYKYLWIRGGKVLMRKAEKEPVFVLTSLDDINFV
ncbi:uncharacterized protein LOC124170068 [Ischnura elegans]|uniref:uncharacterized protein LOC124170068 n=1 Tax=Ischnura elegans TaxID=197161 RepID=UPI001ED87750|nr:uncharacterized protein LOC124170068 [Ischnura elegans]